MEKCFLVRLSFHYEGTHVLHICKTHDVALGKVAQKVLVEGGWIQRDNMQIWNKDNMALTIQERELES